MERDDGPPRLAAVTDDGRAYALEEPDLMTLVRRADKEGIAPSEAVRREIEGARPLAEDWRSLNLLVPVEAPEVWASGVTYERSKEARNEESQGAAGQETVYDKVYRAERPEIFFKSTAARTVGPNRPVCIRSDSSWQVPEPELGLVLDSKGKIVGYTVGNDMSSRDIEGENPLYLPQAKMWRRSCSIGPAIRLAESVSNPYDFTITLQIYRNDELIVEDSVSTNQFKRKLEELVAYLIRDNDIFDGTVLLTGTGIVPPDKFTLQSGDRVDITISSIGKLSNTIR